MIVTKDPSAHSRGVDVGADQKKLETDAPWEIDNPPPGLIDNPINFLFAEHHRQRQAANILHLIADGEFDKAGVENLLEFLKTDFSIHVADEELSFFPLLQQYCLPEDNIEKLIERLAEEHQKDEATVENMISILNGLLSREKLNQETRGMIRNFAEHILQHLALENAVLLPIARARLDNAALDVLSGMMKQRRVGHGG